MMGKAAVGEITSPSPPVGGEEGDDRWKSDAGDVTKWEEWIMDGERDKRFEVWDGKDFAGNWWSIYIVRGKPFIN